MIIDVHRSELFGDNRLGFAIVTADINTSADSVVGYDVAPDSAAFYTYVFTHKAALRLEVTRLHATPARPKAGKPFAITMAVRRSDTGRGITSGAVTCRALINEKPIKTKSAVANGAGRCSLVVPLSAKGKLLRGSISVRSGGMSVTEDYAYLVL